MIALFAAAPPVVTVEVGRPLATVRRPPFGVNAGMWDGRFDRSATVAQLRTLAVGVLRFPGGSSSNAYHWFEHRVANNPHWIPALRFERFVAIARAAGGRPMVTVNYGSGTAEEAAAWVRHANVVHGYQIRDWEIGNEVYGSWEYDTHDAPHDPRTYAREAARFLRAMKAADPSIRVGIPAVPGEDRYPSPHRVLNPRTGIRHSGWTPVVLSTLRELGVRPDFLSYHHYPQDEGRENDARLLASRGLIEAATDLRNQLADYLGAAGKQVGLECTEINSSPGAGKQTTSLVNGLFLAESLAQALVAGFGSLVWFDLRNTTWDTPATHRNNSASLYGWRGYGDYGLVSPFDEPYPTYHVAALLARFVAPGDRVLATRGTATGLGLYATLRPNGSLGLLAVNRHPRQPLRVRITLAGYRPAPRAQITEYGVAQDEAARTGIGSAHLNTWWFDHAAITFEYTFAPYSITLFKLAPEASGETQRRATASNSP